MPPDWLQGTDFVRFAAASRQLLEGPQGPPPGLFRSHAAVEDHHVRLRQALDHYEISPAGHVSIDNIL